MYESIRALLEGVIDYAGLFPPAQLNMARAVDGYASSVQSREGWMLGRYIIPAARLGELETNITAKPQAVRWRVSAIGSGDLMADVSTILAFNAHVRDAVIDSIEVKADTPAAVHEAAAGVPPGLTLYFEIPPEPDPGPLIEAIAKTRHRAKIRTGGLQPDAFPPSSQVARFISRCDEHRVSFKATAGLHHPVRGEYRLTYDAGSPAATMHGFLNLLLASALRWAMIPERAMCSLLEDQAPAVEYSRRGIGWREWWISTAQILRARDRLIVSFGSCSFDEPVAELRDRGLL